MHDSAFVKVPKWPFFLADIFALGLAYFIFSQGKGPLTHWEISAICICVGAGALLSLAPFLLEHRALLKTIELGALTTATEKIQNLELVATQINGATNHWQAAQETADKTVSNAREIADRMASEVKSFTQFMDKMNEGEKATLRLEVEKLRRAENDWLTVVIHTLDHTFALNRAAERSGQANVIGQMNGFQNACRDIARRMGIVPILVQANEPFDAKRHQWTDGDAPPADAVISEMMATGFTFQGRLIRPALVQVRGNGAPPAATKEPEASKPDGEDQLLFK